MTHGQYTWSNNLYSLLLQAHMGLHQSYIIVLIANIDKSRILSLCILITCIDLT